MPSSTNYYTLIGSLPALPRHFEAAERAPSPFRVATFGAPKVLGANYAAVHGIQCVGGISGRDFIISDLADNVTIAVLEQFCRNGLIDRDREEALGAVVVPLGVQQVRKVDVEAQRTREQPPLVPPDVTCRLGGADLGRGLRAGLGL